jgi:hypothetical protein
MLIMPPEGMNKAWENTRPQLQSSIDSILSSLGLKSIIDMVSQHLQSPEFQSIMPVLGSMGLPQGGGGIMSGGFGRGGGATNVLDPSMAVKAAVNGQPPPQQRNITDALSNALPLMKDPDGIARISDLLKLLGGK